MDRFTKLNNVGAAQVASGLYADAVTSFTASLRIIKSYLAVLDGEKKLQSVSQIRSSTQQPSKRGRGVVVLTEHGAATLAVPEAATQALPEFERRSVSPGLYVSPLYLCESANYELYELTVEASVAILFNLALSHHLNALYGPFHCLQELNFMQREPFQSNPVVSTLDQAIALYELAYTMQMQEDVDLSVELTMAIINNLGHIHRRMGDEHKAVKCFRQLLSTILFLQSYGNQTYQTDTFLYSISHLILRDSTAAAA